MAEKFNIVIIGSGNVAFHLSKAFINAGHIIKQVYSRDIEHAKLLAKKIKSEAIDDLNKIDNEADIFLAAVKDDVINTISSEVNAKGKVFLHTSASAPTKPSSKNKMHYGVLYPLQSFSKSVTLNLKEVPFFVDGDKEALSTATQLAKSITSKVYHASEKQRLALHVAAVFANNFTNHLFNISDDILTNEGFTFDVMKPLIEQTLSKIKNHPPAEVQTGPGIRNDKSTIKKHLEYLQSDTELQKIYKVLTMHIQSEKK